MTLCQPTVLKKWQIPKLKRFCIRKFHYLHVQHLKLTLEDTWQVQREFSHQRGASTGRPVADEETELKIDFRIQGSPQAAVEKEDE